MRSEFEKWFKTSRSYLILKEDNYYDLDLFRFNESYQRYVHSGVQIAFEAWQHQQSKVDELQKRVDAVKQLIEDYRDPPTEDKTFQHALSIVADELDQALKGEQP